MSYYAKHLFVCTNRRDKPCRQSCGDNNIGANAIDYLKGHAKAMGLMGVGVLGAVMTVRLWCFILRDAGILIVARAICKKFLKRNWPMTESSLDY